MALVYWSGFALMMVLGVLENYREPPANRIPLPVIILLSVIWPLIVVANIIGLYLKSRTGGPAP